MHPRYRYARDLASLDGKATVLIGDQDEAVDAIALRGIFESHAPRAGMTILPGVNHFGVFSNGVAISAVIESMGAAA